MSLNILRFVIMKFMGERTIAETENFELKEKIIQISLDASSAITSKDVKQLNPPQETKAYASTGQENGVLYISFQKARDTYKISERKLRKLCREGPIEAQKSKGRWKISRISLENWMKSQ